MNPTPYTFARIPQFYSELPGPVKDNNFYQTETNSILKNTHNNHNDFRVPNKENPFMNIQITNYDIIQEYPDYVRYNQSMYPTVETETIKNDVNVNFNNGLFQDPQGTLFNRVNSQRQYYSMPVGSVPNNQEAFAHWLWNTPGNCKQGSIFSRYGVQFTDDSLLCNGFNAASPTNFGQINTFN